MKGFGLNAAAVLGSILLIYLGETYAAGWMFGLSTVILFGLYLWGWKRWVAGNAGLILVTAFMLFTISSIFILDQASILIYSMLLGGMLVPFYKSYRDATATSLVFVLVQLVIYLGLGSIITLWMLFIMNGIFALAGAYFSLKWMSRCFTVFFSMTALFLLIICSIGEGRSVIFLVLAVIVFIAAGIYKFSRPIAEKNV